MSDHDHKRNEAITNYILREWSIIPLRDNSKISNTNWKLHQHIRASQRMVNRWSFQNIAIVTGSVSRLIVMDFDNEEIYQAFIKQFPDLTDTYTVATPRGQHLYYHYQDNVIKTRHGNGVDLQAERAYVVAPPSKIDGNEYQLINDVDPIHLEIGQALTLTNFVSNSQPPTPPNVTPPTPPNVTPAEDTDKSNLNPVDTYKSLLSSGRNTALFKASIICRDNGIGQQRTVALLADVHAQQPPTTAHRSETETQRLREAHNTIKSAYSRPPRTSRQLPNSVRQQLQQNNLTAVARVLDSLRLKGIQPYQTLSKSLIFSTLRDSDTDKMIVGGHSIRIFWKWLTVQNAERAGLRTSAKLPRQDRPKRNQKGRPPTKFRMPSNAILMKWLGVSHPNSTKLTLEDMQSAILYRQAQHREYIKITSGRWHTVQYLADRVGVSQRTIQRYNIDLPIETKANYNTKAITWKTVNELDYPSNHYSVMDGTFLYICNKRYPPNRAIAIKALTDGHTVLYKSTMPNIYNWVG
jgi:hypothetical protein